MLVTALSPIIGYQNAAHIAENAIAKGLTLQAGGAGLGQGRRGALRQDRQPDRHGRSAALPAPEAGVPPIADVAHVTLRLGRLMLINGADTAHVQEAVVALARRCGYQAHLLIGAEGLLLTLETRKAFGPGSGRRSPVWRSTWVRSARSTASAGLNLRQCPTSR